MARVWLKSVRLNWTAIFKLLVGHQQELNALLLQHQGVFKGELGTLVGAKAKIYVELEAKPCYFKARSLPYAQKDKVETELTTLQNEGIIEPFLKGAPIVPIVKPDKTIRICRDYKVTVNPVSKLENYSIPKTEDLLVVLGGGQICLRLTNSFHCLKILKDLQQ